MRKQIAKMQYVYYNANPFDRDTADCAVRAISKFESISWEEAYKRLFRMSLKMKLTFASTQTLHTYLKKTCNIYKVNVNFSDYECPGEEQLLVLRNGDVYHMVYVCNNKYFDTAPLRKNWSIVEIYKKGETK